MAQGPKRTFGGNGNPLTSDGGDTSTPPGSLPSLSSENWQDHTAALQAMTRTQFAGAVGSSFQVIFPAGTGTPAWLTLTAVEDLPALEPANPQSFAVANKQSSIAPATNGYLLRFSSSAQLEQGSYLFVHETLGKFALFTVPDGQQGYAAVVNQFVSGPIIIAVPFNTGSEAGKTGISGASPVQMTAPTRAITVSPATSSETGNLLPGFSGNQVARKGVVRD